MDALGQFDTDTGVRVAWAALRGTSRREISRALLVDLLTPTLGWFTFAQECQYCHSTEHGPLRVLSCRGVDVPKVSIAYAGSIAVVAVAPIGTRCFGIDAELDSVRTRRAVREALRDLDSEGQRAETPTVFLWTRLEAIAKARETGLRGHWQQPDARGLMLTDHWLRVDPSLSSEPIALSIAVGD